MDVNFKFDKEMTEEDIEEFKSLVNPSNSTLSAQFLEGKTVSKTDYPLSNSFGIGQNVRIASAPGVDNLPIICCNFTMFDDLALLAGDTYEDRMVVDKIVQNWEAVKNFLKMLDSE